MFVCSFSNSLMRWWLALLSFTSPMAWGGEVQSFEGMQYQVFEVKPSDFAGLHLAWLNDNEKPLANFGPLQEWLAKKGQRLVFATNAGIYERGPRPCGLTVCDGKEVVPLNLLPGEGNFYLKPNGVFFLDDQRGAGVMEANEYAKSGLRPRLATQSGPLLLRNGKMHPAFQPNSPNKRLRNGVGVRKSDGAIVFVMSDRDDSTTGRVTFDQLSRFFMHLGCPDALYLDGDISDMVYRPKAEQVFRPNTFAGMFYVAEPVAPSTAR